MKPAQLIALLQRLPPDTILTCWGGETYDAGMGPVVGVTETGEIVNHMNPGELLTEPATFSSDVAAPRVGVPLGGLTIKDFSKCRCEGLGECGCAFGQCGRGLIFRATLTRTAP